jgi:hypothetical protein
MRNRIWLVCEGAIGASYRKAEAENDVQQIRRVDAIILK